MKRLRLTNEELALLLKEARIKHKINELFAKDNLGSKESKEYQHRADVWSRIIEKL